MSGVNRRLATLFKAKAGKASDQAEDPRETLHYSYQRQVELLHKVRSAASDVRTSRRRVAAQTAQLGESVKHLEAQAQHALSTGRADLADEALARREAALSQVPDLEAEEASLKADEDRLLASAERMQANVDRFRLRKEQLMANYSAAEAQTAIGEALTGLAEERSGVGQPSRRVQDATERMKAHAATAERLIESEAGSLEDVMLSVGANDLQSEVEIDDSSDIDRELARHQDR